MRKILLLFSFVLIHLTMQASGNAVRQLDLSGLWRFQLDPMGFGKTPGSELFLSRLSETIMLPGSTDQAGKGILNTASYVDRLSRKFEYVGQAWYQREVEIPAEWQGKEIMLTLERCHWETTVYVDGELMASDERLSVPNRFLLTKQLTPGLHTLTICVDNRLKYPMDQWNHGTTEYTQTNWNGIVGKIALTAYPKHFIQKMKLVPDVDNHTISVSCMLNESDTLSQAEVVFKVTDLQNGKVVAGHTDNYVVGKENTTLRDTLDLGKHIRLWNEFTPSLYKVEVRLKTAFGEDTLVQTVGMRKVEQGTHHIRLNGEDIHLRGVLDCAVFPLTGYPSTNPEDWKRIFHTVKEYGFNHVRFHSWCPPEAAFMAADELGLYLQVELPMWIKDVGRYPLRRDFFEKEMYAILDEYGNHPSFILMCNGNENEGDFAVLNDLVKKGRAYDERHLYSASTARTHVKSDQYYVSHVTDKGWITVYEGKPSTDWDRDAESDIDVPVIAHETGQRCMYPDFKEMKKYTGVLEARNFKVFQERLTRNGMLNQADDFFRTTGAHTVLQYKEVNEALLRTANSGGFQLLGLADFPGQGSAFVGILDAFWESKGLVTPEKYRESCAPVVLLARMPKRTYANTEVFHAKLGIYQFGAEDIDRGKLEWNLIDGQARVVCAGKLSHGVLHRGVVDSLGVVDIPLKSIDRAGKYTLQATLGSVRNEWDIWVYPEIEDRQLCPIITDWDEAKKLVEQGKNVLFIPKNQAELGRQARFASHFWNPIMFNWDPMIVGTYIDDRHPSLSEFPTSYYADWQWWDVLNYAVAVDLTDFRELKPVIQSIDTYEVNRKLGIAFEAKVGQGKLFVLNMDMEKNMKQRLAARQLLYSVQKYVMSGKFEPTVTIEPYRLDILFYGKKHDAKNEANEAIKQLLNQ